MKELNLKEVSSVAGGKGKGGSGGSVAVVGRSDSSIKASVHEYAHTYVDLGDEYTSAYPGYPEAGK